MEKMDVGGFVERSRRLFCVHHDALTYYCYGIGSEEYWKYLAEETNMSIQDVKDFWEKDPRYINYVAPVGNATGANDVAGEWREGWTKHERHSAVCAHLGAVKFYRLKFGSDDYWEYLSFEMHKLVEEVKYCVEKHKQYFDCIIPVTSKEEEERKIEGENAGK